MRIQSLRSTYYPKPSRSHSLNGQGQLVALLLILHFCLPRLLLNARHLPPPSIPFPLSLSEKQRFSADLCAAQLERLLQIYRWATRRRQRIANKPMQSGGTGNPACEPEPNSGAVLILGRVTEPGGSEREPGRPECRERERERCLGGKAGHCGAGHGAERRPLRLAGSSVKGWSAEPAAGAGDAQDEDSGSPPQAEKWPH